MNTFKVYLLCSVAYSACSATTRDQVHEKYYTQSSQLAVEHRFTHEYGTISLNNEALQPNFETKGDTDSTNIEPVNDARSKFENALAHKSPRTSVVASKFHFDQAMKASTTTTNAKSAFDSSVHNQSTTNDPKSKFDAVLENQSGSINSACNVNNEGRSGIPKTSVAASTVGQIQQVTKKHHIAATKIQVSLHTQYGTNNTLYNTLYMFQC